MVTIAKDTKTSMDNQRDWVWRGWQIRYLYTRSSAENEHLYPPVLLIHGFGAAIAHWRKTIPAVSQFHRVYALDLLGFGASRKVFTHFTIDLWVQQVYDFWQIFIGQPVILVGNSTGSLVSLVTAFKHPDMVKGLVMLSLPDLSLRQEMIPKSLLPLVNGVEKLFTTPIIIKPLFQFLRRPGVIRRWAGIAYYDKEAITDELVEILATPPQDEGADRTFCALCQSVNDPHFSPSAKAILPQLEIPILLVWGRQDGMIPFKLAPIFAKLNHRVKLVELDRAGHCPHDECPERFNPILLEWLKTIINEQLLIKL